MPAQFSLNAMDPRAFSDIQRLTREENSPEALRAAAEQFEALFMQMVFKAMRDATPQDGIFDNEQTQMFQQLHDQQIAMNLSQQGNGVGLADAIYRQLGGERLEQNDKKDPLTRLGPDGRHYFDLSNVPRRAAISAARSDAVEKPSEPPSSGALDAALIGAPIKIEGTEERREEPLRELSVPERVRGFVGDVWDHAVSAAKSLKVPPQFVIAQAALETGWGQAELRKADGTPSHNLFNIKAGSSWDGPVVELPVTEYANGRPYTEMSRFRAYDSYTEAFNDYAALLRNSERYAGVLGQSEASGFARSLQQAGYATDPLYADKLERIIGGRTLNEAIESAGKFFEGWR